MATGSLRYLEGAALPINGSYTWKAYRTGRELWIPVRYFAEQFGGSVMWDAATFTATLKVDNHTWVLRKDSRQCIIDGTRQNMEEPPLVDPIQSRMYVRDVDSEKFIGIGARVEFNDTVTVGRGVHSLASGPSGVAMAAGLGLLALALFGGSLLKKVTK